MTIAFSELDAAKINSKPKRHPKNVCLLQLVWIGMLACMVTAPIMLKMKQKILYLRQHGRKIENIDKIVQHWIDTSEKIYE